MKAKQTQIQKRIFDITVALVALVFVIPVCTVLCLIIWVTEPTKPPVFWQKRTGLNGKPFTILKLRTMRHNPSAPFKYCAPWKRDPRVTPVGKWLRHFKLDELPQFINVLWGTMSVVGPRPYEVTQDERFQRFQDTPGYAKRRRVKPGITGPGKLNSQDDQEQEFHAHEVQLDIVYAQQLFSWKTDWVYLWRTIRFAIGGNPTDSRKGETR